MCQLCMLWFNIIFSSVQFLFPLVLSNITIQKIAYSTPRAVYNKLDHRHNYYTFMSSLRSYVRHLFHHIIYHFFYTFLFFFSIQTGNLKAMWIKFEQCVTFRQRISVQRVTIPSFFHRWPCPWFSWESSCRGPFLPWNEPGWQKYSMWHMAYFIIKI